jgi:hypothetical protein
MLGFGKASLLRSFKELFSLAADALEEWNSLPEKIQSRAGGAELRRISPRISQVFRNGVQTSIEVD